tara:strand:+ start:57462 stop:58631 length:1170 start_codon:yes stop_codon:yes gene_type:complete
VLRGEGIPRADSLEWNLLSIQLVSSCPKFVLSLICSGNIMRALFSIASAVVFALCVSAHAETVRVGSPLVSALTYLDVAHAGQRIVAVGDRGSILYSDDDGINWVPAKSSTSVLLTSVCFADSYNGWAVGHDATVLGTKDGGETWAVQYSDVLGGADDSAEEDFSEEDYDDYGAYDDYGDDAGVAMPVDTSGAPFLDVMCDSKERAIAVGGYGYVVETQDGGESWVKRNEDIPNPDGWHIYAIERVPGTSTLIAAGEKGTLLRSRDNGVSWQKLDSPYGGTFFGITSTFHVTLIHGMQGKVFASRDGGSTWNLVKTGVTRAVNAGVVLKDGTIILAGASGSILVSHDKGSSVALQYLPNRESISGLLPIGTDRLVMVGDRGITLVNDIR